MKSWKPISFCFRSTRPSGLSRLQPCVVAMVLVMGASIATHAKDSSLTAIVLFDGPPGPAYVQITDVELNGKIEVRSCDGVSKIDKNIYGGLPRVSLAGASSL